MGLGAARRRGRIRGTLIILILLSGALSSRVAAAGTTGLPSAHLSSNVDSSGTGSLVTSVRTPELRAAAPDAAPRILMIGTGVQRSLFPPAVQSSITGSGLTDSHGYGTIAASTILQLQPGARITSTVVRSFDQTWTLLDMHALASALTYARDHRDEFDAVLLAFPPNAALDPIPDIAGHLDYGKFGKGLTMLQEALLTTESPTDGPVTGIPLSRTLRDRIFAKANLRQRDAVEKYVASALGWRAVTRALDGLDDAGVAVIAPAGDYTRKQNDQIVPLPTQTVFGVSAVPSVITVGASYGPDARVSPTSGRGPTLSLGLKPDLVAPADVMTMLPATARLSWPDDSARVPLQTLEWGGGITPSTCPSVNRDYRCVLQGSSMVSAAVVAANVAGMVADATPRARTGRAASDDEILRGIAVSAASRTQARTFDGAAAAPVWEQGAGALAGLANLDLSAMPVALQPGDLGQVAWGTPRSRTISFWSGGARPVAATVAAERFLGPDASGAALSLPFADPDRFDVSIDADAISVTASDLRYQGGFYAGHVGLVTADGSVTELPVSVTQTLPLDLHVNAAYNEFQGNGTEGERVEDQTVVLFPGLPAGVGLIGEAFKTVTVPAFNKTGGDPTNGLTIRYGTTRSQFRDPSLPASEHGRARISAVPPGFWRIHLLADNAVEAAQARGRHESLGIGLGSSGPEGAYSPGPNLLVAEPPCGTSGVRGPLTSCASRNGEVDPSSGLCVARNSATLVAYHVYCGEMALALPIGTVSRAVHLIEHNADPARSEWRNCGVNLPTDGSTLDLAKIVDQARSCPGATSPSAWSFGTRSPDCLGPRERAAYPTGMPTDVDAVYGGLSAPGTPGRNLPVGVLTYEFKLPALNTYTTAGLSLAYKAENAIVAVRFRTGTAATDDAANGLLVVDAPNVTVTPPIAQTAGTRGSVFTEWAVMSANATVGQLSIVVIPTAWSRPDLDPSKAIARVQLCDVALRVATFAKQAWGRAGSAGAQLVSMADRGLVAQIDPATHRERAAWNGSAFEDLGQESESLRFAVQVPKNSTMDRDAPHHVRSPRGGPGYLSGARGASGTSLLSADYRQYDLRRGLTTADCHDGGTSTDPAQTLQWNTCGLWEQARDADQILAEIAPETVFNGRFHGVYAADEAALRASAGGIMFQSTAGDDRGLADAAGHWTMRNGSYVTRMPVSDFYDDALTPFSLVALSGQIKVTPGSAPVLSMTAAAHTISSTLR